jgi:hypothetical protein
MVFRPTLVIVFACFLFSTKARADDSLPYTKLTLVEAKSLVKVGMSEKEVKGKVGSPTLVESAQEPTSCWLYCTAPPESTYGGFAIIFKNHKVSELDVINGPT